MTPHHVVPIISLVRTSTGELYYLGCPQHVLVTPMRRLPHRLGTKKSQFRLGYAEDYAPFGTREEIVRAFFQHWNLKKSLPCNGEDPPARSAE